MRIPSLTLGICLLTSVLIAGPKPNVIIIFNDDQGYQDLGCYGSPTIKTPHIDKMAEEGMRFTDFYVASPICSASRAALMTGCYPVRVGVGQGVFWPNRPGGLPPEETTIAEVLKSAGYQTMAVGKWHLGDDPKYLPTNQGFDSYFGIPYSNDMYPAKSMKYADDCLYLEGMSQEKLAAAFTKTNKRGNPDESMRDKVPLMRDEECVEFPADQSTITKRFADEGIEFISESVAAEKPFFLYLANSMPHVPLFVSPGFEGKSEGGLYGDVIEEIDFHTGRLLAHLETLGVDENTLVVFSSDNGPWLVKGDRAGSALPLFEGKATHFEGGHRVPGIIKWPAKVPAGSVNSEVVSTMDLLPTIAHIAGAELPADKKLDGKNIIDIITGQEWAKSPHEYFFFGKLAVRWGDWKYHGQERYRVAPKERRTKEPTLYNLKEDIGESRNVIDEYPEVAARLAKVLAEENPNVKRKE